MITQIRTEDTTRYVDGRLLRCVERRLLGRPLQAARQPSVIVAFTVIAVVTKYLRAIWGARTEGPRIAREVDVGMVPRGEVGIVVAGIALASGALSEEANAAVLGMVLATTMVSPYLIKAAFSRKKPANDASSEPDAALIRYGLT